MIIENNDLVSVKGGGSVTLVSFINSMVRALNSFKDLGSTFGSALRKFIIGKYC